MAAPIATRWRCPVLSALPESPSPRGAATESGQCERPGGMLASLPWVQGKRSTPDVEGLCAVGTERFWGCTFLRPGVERLHCGDSYSREEEVPPPQNQPESVIGQTALCGQRSVQSCQPSLGAAEVPSPFGFCSPWARSRNQECGEHQEFWES